ncbi:hypothetical protein ACIQU6_38420 [Streptomyces sp. NPDC090442]|uniref:hypothetical protein n=1 Tax=Streptomyces sp. NPDC090442 TaxID=3365962 RepID=UPI0037FCA597
MSTLAPLRPGTPVTYHDSLAAYRGKRIAHPCECRRCFDRKLRGLPVQRYDLWPANGIRPRSHFPEHARRSSVTPFP